MMDYRCSIFVFRRDLRLDDNTGLIAALKSSEKVFPCFIFDPRQTSGKYFSPNAFQFMCESLEELNNELKAKGSRLHIFIGLPHIIIPKIAARIGADAVFINRDYTPFSINRDKEIAWACSKMRVAVRHFSDYLLTEPELLISNSGAPLTVFSQFYRKALQFPVRPPEKNRLRNYYSQPLDFEQSIPKFAGNPDIFCHGGRKNAKKIIANLPQLANYKDARDYPALSATTGLSAHHKFGTISIRESYYAIVKLFGFRHELVRQLYWRDFFTYIGFHYPHVFGKPFRLKYAGIKWKTKSQHFNAWKEGKTGVPIVDAGMRELNKTGFMHNRVRMITASFLVKDLHIDWREGERYFATKLVDYDPAVNNGNWQWVASTGCDSQPYFRVFNPWLQQKKFDPDCAYIKKWVPELSDLPPLAIHELYRNQKMRPRDYPPPIVDHQTSASIIKNIFRSHAT
ncbi:MAG: DNA photolyase family protein [Candidatus Micrarchaeota archaeon]|nr:DNA photolyase family protein [Candidatus Micrarchaeota archaeon]